MSSLLAGLGKRHRDVFESDGHDLEQEFQTKRKKKQSHREFIDMYDVISTTLRSMGTECEGDRRLQRIKQRLDQFKWARSPDQFRFHEDFIKLCLPHIYGSDFEANRVRLMKMFNLTSFKVGSLILCPRRWGKTTSVAMFIAALVAECEGVALAIFSPLGSTSSELASKVIEKLLELPGCHARVVKSNTKRVEFARPSEVNELGELKHSKADIIKRHAVNTIAAYPANPDGKTMKEEGPLCVSDVSCVLMENRSRTGNAFHVQLVCRLQ